MCLITGRIETIEPVQSSPGQSKDVVTIVSNDNQKAFIEFRSPQMMAVLKSFKENDQVIISVKFDGKIAKTTGVRFNNIVATSIQKV